MTSYKHRADRPECDNCGAEAPTTLSDWGPPYTQEHSEKQQALCPYCYCVSDMGSDENRHRAQMMNLLESRLRAALPPKSSEEKGRD